jgi:predicted transcriptional regulator
MVKKEKRVSTVTVRVTEDMRAKLERLAAEDRRTVSSLAEILLERALADYEKPRKR